MTSKDRANQIYSRFCYESIPVAMSRQLAINCIDEILQAIKSSEYGITYLMLESYYQNVKLHLQNML